MDQTKPFDQRPFVDDAGLLIAYQQMDRLRPFTRRHAVVRWTRHTPQHPEEFHVNVIEELALVGLEAMGL